jgi:hypothetical protein
MKAEQAATAPGQVPSFSDFNLNMDELEKQQG